MEFEVDGFSKAMAAIEGAELPIYQDPGCICNLIGGSMSAAKVQEHISEAAKLLLGTASSIPRPGAGTIAESIHALLWPFVVAAAREFNAPPSETVPGAEDRRSKPWQLVVRFWRDVGGEDSEPELIGETDPMIITSTGALPKIITDLAAQMHEGEDIDELALNSIKGLLPQFRNNLGRGHSAALRIPYDLQGIPHRCQADVLRLSTGI
jgi:hypothetical protein